MGYWEPHTSSIDFCEPNYLLSTLIVEPHNAFSSLFITFFGMVGLLYGNPAGELRCFAMNAVLAAIGIGSFGLHATLNWFTQSLDEVPMLWMNLAYIYNLVELNSQKSKKRIKGLEWYLLAFAIVQTAIYYYMRSIYIFFIVTYTSTVALVVLWTGSLAFRPENASSAQFLYCLSIASYVIVGSLVWLLDMVNCHALLPYYLASPFGGITLHVLWHFAAGFGAYLMTTFIVFSRLQALGGNAQLDWVLGFIPVAIDISAKKQR